MDSQVTRPVAADAHDAGALVPPAALHTVAGATASEEKDTSAWSQRYIGALARSQEVAPHSQEAADGAAKGLEEWAHMLPHRGCRCDGRSVPANRWGLGIERSIVRALRSHLVAMGRKSLADRLASEMRDLLETARALDRACRGVPADAEAEKRLVGTAQFQARALADLLREIDFERPSAGRGATRRAKRPQKPCGAPLQTDPEADRKLMEAWTQVRGKGGMKCKEFCAARGISVGEFIHAQDRHRKRSRSHRVR